MWFPHYTHLYYLRDKKWPLMYTFFCILSIYFFLGCECVSIFWQVKPKKSSLISVDHYYLTGPHSQITLTAVWRKQRKKWRGEITKVRYYTLPGLPLLLYKGLVVSCHLLSYVLCSFFSLSLLFCFCEIVETKRPFHNTKCTSAGNWMAIRRSYVLVWTMLQCRHKKINDKRPIVWSSWLKLSEVSGSLRMQHRLASLLYLLPLLCIDYVHIFPHLSNLTQEQRLSFLDTTKVALCSFLCEKSIWSSWIHILWIW